MARPSAGERRRSCSNPDTLITTASGRPLRLSDPMPERRSPLLFLSHAGIDTEAARALKRRLEAAPRAREVGLRVWFDKDDLGPGRLWQPQLEEAILHRSTTFAVYLGSRCVVNWIEAEVGLALSRATRDPGSRFIPV